LKNLEDQKNESSFQIPLRQIRNNLNNPQELLTNRVKKELPRNPHEKIKFLIKIFDLKGEIVEIMKELGLEKYQTYFHQFQQLRNLVAHHEPLPSIQKLELPSFINDFDLESYQKQINTKFPPIKEDRLFLKPLLEHVEKWINSIAPLFFTLHSLFIMVAFYPAILDRIYFTHFSSSS
jgi:hypothetical protein